MLIVPRSGARLKVAWKPLVVGWKATTRKVRLTIPARTEPSTGNAGSAPPLSLTWERWSGNTEPKGKGEVVMWKSMSRTLPEMAGSALGENRLMVRVPEPELTVGSPKYWLKFGPVWTSVVGLTPRMVGS